MHKAVREDAPRFALGRHLTVEYCGCDPRTIADPSKVESAFLDAARHSGATVLNWSFHRFEPQGVSGFVLISESHFSIHAWPEHNYAAVDIFTCGDKVSPEKAVSRLKELLGAKEAIVSADMHRGTVCKMAHGCCLGFTCEGADGEDAGNWRKTFERSGAYGMLCAVDIGGCSKGRMESAAEPCVRALLSLMGVESPDGGELVRSSFDGIIVCSYRPAGPLSVSGRFDSNAGSAFLELFSRRYFEPRDCAEKAVEALSGSGYKLHLALRM